MKYFFLVLFFPLLAFSLEKEEALYHSIDQQSIKSLLAYHLLYPDTPCGKLAKKKAFQLANITSLPSEMEFSLLFIDLFSKPLEKEKKSASPLLVEALKNMTPPLPHTFLKGHTCLEEKEVLLCPVEEIDIARGIFVAMLEEENLEVSLKKEKIESMEALLDLMALEIQGKLSCNASHQEKIEAINDYIFFEEKFHFPPKSTFKENIDSFSFLPSVLDEREGVCLGTSMLYLALGQRLNLPLVSITPPGHIFVAYEDKDTWIGIETTHRGIHLKQKDYLGFHVNALEKKDNKEAIGLSFFNQAAFYWRTKEYDKALACYLKAEKYIPKDPLLKDLKAFILFLLGKEEEALSLLSSNLPYLNEGMLEKELLTLDLIHKKVGKEGIEISFSQDMEGRKEVEKRKMEIETLLKKYPESQSLLFQLGATLATLGQEKKAYDIFKKLHKENEDRLDIAYYVTILALQTGHIDEAKKYYKATKELAIEKKAFLEPFKELQKEILMASPS